MMLKRYQINLPFIVILKVKETEKDGSCFVTNDVFAC